MKAVNLIVNHHLPADLRDYGASYDSKGLGKIMGQVALAHPEQYEAVAKVLSDIGREASWRQGETIHLGDMLPVLDRDKIFAEMDSEIQKAKENNPDPDAFEEARMAIWSKYSDALEKMTMKEALKKGNNLAYSVVSGARGKPPQLKSMLTTPGLYTDYKDDPIPLFVRNSFGDGLRPAEYLAGAFGARKSVISTKMCCIKGTLVRMADGTTRAIEDIKVGELVIGSDKDGVTSPVRVVRVIHQGKQSVYKYSFRFSNSQEVTHTLFCTEDHKLLMTDKSAFTAGWSRFWRHGGSKPDAILQHNKTILPAARLGVNGRAAVLPTGGNWVDGKDEPYAKFIGLMLGDGCMTGKALSLSCADNSLIGDITTYLDTLGLKIKKAAEDNFSWPITSKDYTPTMNGSIVKGTQGFVKGSRITHNQVLESYGLRGKYAWEKTLPTDIWYWNDTSVKQLVAAYFACDGSVYSTTQKRGRQQVSISFSSTSEALLVGVKDILSARFGIQAGKVQSTDEGGFRSSIEQRVHTLYYFSIGSVVAVKSFARLFGPFVPGVKRARLTSMTESVSLKQNNPYSKLSLYSKEFIGDLECWDLEVDNDDHLFVLANGIIVSNSTAKGGDFAKQANQSTAATMVVKNDCGTRNGIALDTEDPSLRGRVLAMSVDGVPAGTLLDKHAVSKLRKQGVKTAVVRSAMTCSLGRGVCAKCIGAFYDGGKLPKIGDAVGITGASAIGEPITQSALNQKHVAGVSAGKREYSGFDVINQIAQSPEIFPDKATLSEVDGRVHSIDPAPQGGNYVTVDTERHYVPPGYAVLAKVGDRVEAGDQLADGIIDPGEIVRLRGLGEGRKFYSERLKKALDDSGMPADSRNTEILARSAIDHVVIDDPEGMAGYLPDDVASYNSLSRDYVPPADVKSYHSHDAVGKYLQVPVLHYSIGTKLTPRMVKQLADVGVSHVQANDTAPQFSAEMSRLRTAAHVNEDWLASQHTSHLKLQLNDAAVRGADTNIESNIHFVPRLAYGKGFGENINQTGKF